MLRLTLAALKMIEIENYIGCVNKVEELLSETRSSSNPKLSGLLKKHFDRLRKISEDLSLNPKTKLARFKVPLVNIEIILNRYKNGELF